MAGEEGFEASSETAKSRINKGLFQKFYSLSTQVLTKKITSLLVIFLVYICMLFQFLYNKKNLTN